MYIQFKRWRKVRLVLVLFALLLSGGAYSQQLSLHYKNVPLTVILDEITAGSGYKFVYSDALKAIHENKKFSLEVSGEPLRSVLDKLFEGTGIIYTIEGQQIVLAPQNIAVKKGVERKQEVKPGKRVSGVVTDESGELLPGVTIRNRATKQLAATGINGAYSVSAGEGDILVFSSIGMVDYEAPVGKGNVLNVAMKSDLVSLDDVVVTGYQTISKERATGAFVKVDSNLLKTKPVVNIASALNGITPGMTVSFNADGQARFLIRGQGTMRGEEDRDPLVVVDGFPIQGFIGGSLQTGYNSERDPFSSINPNDVESITVLKDAAATSIYGARAANGVIVITTKKGKKGDKLNINVGAFVSVGSKPDLDYAFNMANTAQTIRYLENLEEYSSSYNSPYKDPYFTSTNPVIYLPQASELLFEYKRRKNLTEEQYKAGVAQLLDRDGKWMEEYNKHLFRNSINQQYNLSLNGGSEKNRYNFSIAYDRNLGMSKGNTKNRIVMNFSNTYEIIKNLSFYVGVNAQISRNENNGIAFSDLKSYTTPYLGLFNPDGSYAHIATPSTVYEPILNERFGDKLSADWHFNPLQDRDEKSNLSKMFNTRFQAGLDYKIVEGLNVSVKGQYERNQYKNRNLYRQNSFYVRDYYNKFSTPNPTNGRYESYFPKGGIFTDSGDLYSSYNLRGQIDYNKTFAQKHGLVVLLGGEIISSTREIDPPYTRYGYNENTNAVQAIPDYISKVENIYGQKVNYPYTVLGGLRTFEDRFLSAYFNVSYSYDRRYNLTASVRTDASNFISDAVRKKFSPFWSVGAAWNMMNESFMKEISWIDNLKLRGSYGIAGVAAGKSAVSTLTTLSVWAPSVIFTNNEPYCNISIKGNPTLTWEKARTLNIGLDFSLFKGKLYGSIDYYNKYSYDVLAEASRPLIAQSQNTSRYNNAEISNRGIEIILGSEQKIANRISWRGDFNFSYNQNRVEVYNVIPTSFGGLYVPGRPLGCIYAYNLVSYTPEGYQKMQGKDGTVQIVKSKLDTHLYDVPNAVEGDTFDSSNWKIYQGTSIAPYNMGFTNTFRIYDFTLSFMITGKFGHLFNNWGNYPTDEHRSPYYAKCLEDAMNNDYTGPYTQLPIYNDENKEVFNTGSFYAYARNLHGQSTAMVEKGDHIRLNEVYLGYDMPRRLLGGDNGFVKGLNIYAQARNLGLLWSANGRGIDPDYIWGNIKPVPTWTFGVKLNF